MSSHVPPPRGSWELRTEQGTLRIDRPLQGVVRVTASGTLHASMSPPFVAMLDVALGDAGDGIMVVWDWQAVMAMDAQLRADTDRLLEAHRARIRKHTGRVPRSCVLFDSRPSRAA
jgi:hypothetical protein